MKRLSIFSFALLGGSALILTLASPGLGGRGGGGMPPIARARTNHDLAPPTTPTKAPDADGFIQRWLILDPVAAQGVSQNEVQAAVKIQYFPDQLSIIPKDGQTVAATTGQLAWHAVDTMEFKVNLYHFGPMINKPTDNVIFWAVTVVDCPQEMKGARLAIGSNDASIWWVNGQEVTGIYGDRPCTIDDGVSKRLTLKKGANVIRGAIHNRAGATDFCARLLDSNEEPIRNITINLAETGK